MFKEYEPRCGWLAYNRRKAIKEKIKSTLIALVGFAVFAAASTLCESF